MGYYKSLYSSVDVRIHTEWYLQEWEMLSLSNKKKKEISYIYYPARCKYIYIRIYIEAQMAEITIQLMLLLQCCCLRHLPPVNPFIGLETLTSPGR